MPGGLTSSRASPVAAGLAIVTGLAVIGCGRVPSPVGEAAPPGIASASPSPSAAGPGRAVAPLTGLPVSVGEAARPAVALDVAGPNPRGLAAADVVFEEIGSPVRYIAVYQSRQASGIGPITTTQPTDRGLLAVLRPLIGYDGAVTNYFTKLLDQTKITDVGYTTHPSRYTTTAAGVTTATRAIAAAARGAAPQPLFSYRGAGGALASKGQSRAGTVTVALPGTGVQDWTFNQHADRWALTRGGPAVLAANLVIQSVSYKEINVNVRQGIVVPTAKVIGSGRVEVFSGSAAGGTGGTAATGTWSKPNAGDLTNYFDSSGTSMAFEPGPTWVILAPPATRVSTSGA